MASNREKQSKLKAALDFLIRLLGHRPPQTGDPYAFVTAPAHRGPKGRSGAAVAEIEDDSFQSFPLRRS